MIIIAVTATNSIAKVCFSLEIAKKKMRFSELAYIRKQNPASFFKALPKTFC